MTLLRRLQARLRLGNGPGWERQPTLTLVRRLLGYFWRYRLLLGGGVACSVLVAGLTGAYAWLVKPALDGIFIDRNQALLTVLPLALLGIAVLKGLATYGQNYLMNYVGSRIIADIREALYGQFLRLPVRFHDANTSGRLAARVLSDISLMANAVTGTLKELLQQGFTFATMLGVLFAQNWRLAAASLVVVPGSVYAMRRMTQRVRALVMRQQDWMGDMASALQETLAGIRVVKAFGREDAERARFHTHNKAYVHTILKTIQVSAWGNAHLEVTGVVGVAVIIWYGGYLVIHGTMTPGAFFSFLTAMVLAYNPVRRVASANTVMQQALVAAERVFAMLDLDDEWDRTQGRQDLAPLTRSLQFRHVTLRYDGTDRPALRGVDFTVQAGELVALVGRTGSGKTSLVNLVLRFYEPTEGAIVLDGRDIRDGTLRSLRAQIGLVSQDVVLFDETVKHNIAYGRGGATDKEIVEAARLAYADAFIAQLPQGYDTRIGENGVKLSGGERQRLAIARAFLRDPPLLILDEPTSALDAEAERMVQRALANLMQHRTTLVIAHRLSTARRADRIVVLDDGQVREEGTHAALMQRGGLYRQLYALQFQDEPGPAAVAEDRPSRQDARRARDA